MSLRSVPPPASLRFGLGRVPVSYIASQFFCELKLDRELCSGSKPSEQLIRGIELHSKLIQPSSLCSSQAYGCLDGFPISGIPDGVVFVDSKPRYLVELKISPSFELHGSELVQLDLYAFCLDWMGFDVSKLELGLLKLWSSRLSPTLAGIAFQECCNALISGDLEGFRRKFQAGFRLRSKIELLEYDQERAGEWISRARGYWELARDPVPNPSELRCSKCGFFQDCPGVSLGLRSIISFREMKLGSDSEPN